MSHAREAALASVLGLNSNKVVWSDCHIIWDSYALIHETAEDGVSRPLLQAYTCFFVLALPICIPFH